MSFTALQSSVAVLFSSSSVSCVARMTCNSSYMETIVCSAYFSLKQKYSWQIIKWTITNNCQHKMCLRFWLTNQEYYFLVFWSLLKWASFLETAGALMKIGFNLKPCRRAIGKFNQVMLVPILNMYHWHQRAIHDRYWLYLIINTWNR